LAKLAGWKPALRSARYGISAKTPRRSAGILAGKSAWFNLAEFHCESGNFF